MKETIISSASSSGQYANTGNGYTFQTIDISHDKYVALIEPVTAFWSLIKKEKLGEIITEDGFQSTFKEKRNELLKEMNSLRFELKPGAVYFNPTDRCNLNCKYCYIPSDIRKNGINMSQERLFDALALLKNYFAGHMPQDRYPQIVFHGAEPLMNKEAILAGIEEFQNDFRFGIQTNATLLDEDTIHFLKKHEVSIGLSLDGANANIADRLRITWGGEGVSAYVEKALACLKGYPHYSVICTVTQENLHHLKEIVQYFHNLEVPFCMLNQVRCTLPGAREVKPSDADMGKALIEALDESYRLYEKTGRKLIVANFANVLIGILAPTARRLMCDISPCGGGRCFFAMAANGDLFPCSEFIGLDEFKGGNLFSDNIESVLSTPQFKKVSERKVEDIIPCNKCSIRHFCGSPCPAEAHEMNGGMDQTGAFCEFYEEQVRYAFRLIADGKENAFLWDGWDEGAEISFQL